MKCFAVCLVVAATAVTAPAQWVQRSPGVAPPDRGMMAMTYDWGRGNVVTFSGFSLATGLNGLGDTWTYDGSTWQQLSPAVSPSPRARCSMVYDIVRGVAVLHGGATPANNQNPNASAETWEWDGVTWTEATPAVSVGPRNSYGMAYDISRGRVVLYGGIKKSGGISAESDTWEYDGTTWTKIATPNSPGPRAGMAMCYDWRAGKTYLFGGVNPQTGGFNDTWEYDGSDWRQLSFTGTLPPAREDARMVYDSVRQRVVLYGGLDLSATPAGLHNDTWEFDGVRWTPISSAPATARAYVGMAFDGRRRRVVAFGGLLSSTALTTVSETWEYGGYVNFGKGCPGSGGVPSLSSNSSPRLGQPFTISMTDLNATSPTAFLVFGASSQLSLAGPLPLDLAFAGMPGCTLYASLDLVLPVPASAGSASFTWTIAPDVSLIGLEFFNQAISVDPGINPINLVLSNAATGVVTS